jgi:hypothetical protein
MCNNNYFVRCSNIPIVGSEILAQLGRSVADGDGCRMACDARTDCSGFVYALNPPFPHTCDLYGLIGGFNMAGNANTYIRICPNTCEQDI